MRRRGAPSRACCPCGAQSGSILTSSPSINRYYSDLAGAENASKYQTGIYLAGSATAEFVADIFLCPFEAVKVWFRNHFHFRSRLLCRPHDEPEPRIPPSQVKVQTNPTWARGLGDGLPKFIAQEGYGG